MNPYLKLLRPPLLFLGLLAPVSLMRFFHSWDWYVLGAIFFFNASFNVFNEVFDVETDRINKPHKPLPSGEADIGKSLLLAFLLSYIGLVFLVSLPTEKALLGFIAFVSGAIYNLFKERGTIGNLCLGSTYGLAAYISSYPNGLIFSTAFGLLTIFFNIGVQLQDLDAEKKAGIKTFPMYFSLYSLAYILTLLLVIILELIIFSEVPIISKIIFSIAAFSVAKGIYYGEYELFIRIFGRGLLILLFLSLLF